MKQRSLSVRVGSREVTLQVTGFEPCSEQRPGRLRARLDGEELQVTYRLQDPDCVQLIRSDGNAWIRRVRVGGGWHVAASGCHLQLEGPITHPVRAAFEPDASPEVTPPMPAVVVKVLVEAGDRVRKGQPLVVLSAMKMETTLVAPKDGRAADVNAQEGDKVSPGQILLRIKEDRDQEDDHAKG